MRSATSAPTSAPPPSAPKSQPRMCGSAPYFVTTSTGSDAKKSVQQTSSSVNAGVHTRSSRSREQEAHAGEHAALVLLRAAPPADARTTSEEQRTRRGRWRRRRRGRSTRRSTAIRTPASGGPRKIVSRFAAWNNAVAVATSPCSSPTSSGTTARCTPKYGAMKTPLAATSASSTGNGSSPSDVQQRDRGEQRHAREVADQHRAPRAEPRGDRPAPEAEQRDRHDLGDEHPRHPLRRARSCAGRTTAARARSSACPSDEITSAPSSAASAAVAQQAHGSAAAPKLITMRLRAAPCAAAAELVEQLPRSARRAPRARAASARASPTRSASRAASAARARARGAARRGALLLAPDELVAEDRRLEAVGRELDPRSQPRARAARGRRRFSPSSTKPHLRERAQVVAAGGRAVADDARALGRGRLLDRVQVVEQREARRVGEGAHRARVGQGEGAIERDLSKLLFREPGVKYLSLLLAIEPCRRIGRAPRRSAPTRACRAPSPRAAAFAGPRRARARAAIALHRRVLRLVQPHRQLHPLADPCSTRNPASTQTISDSTPVDGLARLEQLLARRHGADRVVGARRGRVSAASTIQRREVARVDHLRVAVRGRGREHLPARGEALRPVREPARRVPRAADQPGRGMNASGKRARTTSSQSAFSGP